MDWINRLNSAINYMEEHMKSEIDMEEVGKIAGCSSYHFQRMFTYMADVTLSEYIRRRRMSLAAVDLLSGEKVIDVACSYGYDSPTAFNRAFKNIHGIAPSKISEKGVSIKSYPPIRFHITVKGECEMDYRIVKKEEFRIIGISMPLEKELEKNLVKVPQMWAKAHADGTIPRLLEMMSGNMPGILGVSTCNNGEDWKYYIAVAGTANTPDDMEEYIVPAFTWAVFSEEGAGKSIQDLETRIVTEWLPTSGYEYADGPDVEVYLDADPVNMKYEVWIPVVKKKEEEF